MGRARASRALNRFATERSRSLRIALRRLLPPRVHHFPLQRLGTEFEQLDPGAVGSGDVGAARFGSRAHARTVDLHPRRAQAADLGIDVRHLEAVMNESGWTLR